MTVRPAAGPRTVNWAGNVRYGAARFSRPASIGELQDLVAGSERARALGTGHSFSPVADTGGHLIAVDRLPVIMEIDSRRAVVLASAGLSYAELSGYLHRSGWGLANLGSLPHISVAGACATGTHGSGNGNGSLATAVTGLELVTAKGEIVTLSRDTDRDSFDGAVVSLGTLGVVTTLTLGLEPDYPVRQYVYDDLPADRLAEHLAEIFAAAYSVSLFTDWRGPLIRQVWLKYRADAPGQPPPPHWLGARLADGPRHPVPGGDPTACTTQRGVPGPWHERLPHFRPGFVPSAGAELQSEYLVPAEQAVEALARIGRIAHLVAPALHISELRTVAADQLWLSPAYQRDSLAIHFTWVADAAAVRPALAAVERQLAPLEPRPHWGKLFTTEPEQVAARYPRMPDFRQLRRHLDPGGKFRNDFTDAYLHAG
jgi:xylitol oxidase